MQSSRLWYIVQWHLQLLSHKSRRPSESHVSLHVSARGTLEAVESFRSIIRPYAGTSLRMDDNNQPPAAGKSQQHIDDVITGLNWHAHSPDAKGATTGTWSLRATNCLEEIHETRIWSWSPRVRPCILGGMPTRASDQTLEVSYLGACWEGCIGNIRRETSCRLTLSFTFHPAGPS